jgi:hypothetical protein
MARCVLAGAGRPALLFHLSRGALARRPRIGRLVTRSVVARPGSLARTAVRGRAVSGGPSFGVWLRVGCVSGDGARSAAASAHSAGGRGAARCRLSRRNLRGERQHRGNGGQSRNRPHSRLLHLPRQSNSQGSDGFGQPDTEHPRRSERRSPRWPEHLRPVPWGRTFAPRRRPTLA